MPLQDVQPYIAFLGTIVQLGAALLLSVLFLILRRYADRRKYFTAWSLAWLALTTAILAVVVRYNILPTISAPILNDDRLDVRILYAIYQVSKLAFYGLLTGGTLLYLRGSLPAGSKRALLMSATAYTAFSLLMTRDLNQMVMMQAPASVLAASVCSFMVFSLPRSRRTVGSLAVGGVFALMAILWAMYFAAFGMAGPMMPTYPGPDWLVLLVRYNSYFDGLTHLALGYGMVVLLMEDAKREVDNAHRELAVAHDDLRRASLHDSVTGSLNRRAFQEGLGLEAARATFGTVLMIDMDNLKAVNDRYGHAAGDALLRYLVEVLRAELRTSDKLYRWGGDEFLIVFPGSSPAKVRRRMEQVMSAAAPLEVGPEGRPAQVMASLGAAHYSSAEQLRHAIEQADAEMYREKHRRKAGRQLAAAG
jgi:diguanylate cyclase (GGDEF)-like protein